MPAAVRLEAPAKVNLFLEILRRRLDGYHELSTLFQQISLADELEARPAGGACDALTVRGAKLSSGPDNLVLKAARAFRERYPDAPAVRFLLRKRVPIGAGLGGGSSDAAAALRACWTVARGNSRLPWRELVPAATGVGADVPFFLRGGLAEGAGIGDRLTPLSASKKALAGVHFVLLFPRVFLSTKWVYERLRFPLTKRRSNRTLRSALLRGSPASKWAPLLFNRLEEVVLPRVAPVRRAKTALLRAGCLGALMSGSGSAVFGVTDSAPKAAAIARGLRGPNWDLWVVRPAG